MCLLSGETIKTSSRPSPVRCIVFCADCHHYLFKFWKYSSGATEAIEAYLYRPVFCYMTCTPYQDRENLDAFEIILQKYFQLEIYNFCITTKSFKIRFCLEVFTLVFLDRYL